jgi:hypothetical protein
MSLSTSGFACQLLGHSPLPGPWQTLVVVDVLSKGLLPHFSDATSDDVFYRFFDALTTADFVDQLYARMCISMDFE